MPSQYACSVWSGPDRFRFGSGLERVCHKLSLHPALQHSDWLSSPPLLSSSSSSSFPLSSLADWTVLCGWPCVRPSNGRLTLTAGSSPDYIYDLRLILMQLCHPERHSQTIDQGLSRERASARLMWQILPVYTGSANVHNLNVNLSWVIWTTSSSAEYLSWFQQNLIAFFALVLQNVWQTVSHDATHSAWPSICSVTNRKSHQPFIIWLDC